ncbi:MAG: glutamine-hydrolyzing carbamoyl-phosphate synthase small subunit [Acidobacteria bacterium]|nr:glutamine-hydrolyzing carbamoyl-phosphate synthase small subunit [Acidobacteriota bacterium]TDI49771.1 MAG: carbamoyl-phosphate synthase small subunit [Acidobacteriota bacterium]TDI56674.1 MAG: carbamoyl-phosphate synthase small subunit [Acidobacteriota bacterium]
MREKVPALLATADGTVFRGNSVGGPGVASGEAVFNTSMTGYQEILTDPSYAGQIVVMTYPHIGNYGVVEFDAQSSGPAVSGFIMRSLSRRESSWRSEGSLADYLLRHDVVAVSEVDTRRLTRHIRDRGAMPIAMGSDVSETELIDIAADTPTMAGQDLASSVTTREPYRLDAEGDAQGLVVAIDLGLKREILRNLTGRGFEVVVVPAATDAETILGMSPSGVFVSNGPGDPEPLTATTKSLRDLLGQRPLFGICLGHQVLGLAVGASTFKLPFGHHGGNHPVRRLDDNRVYITTQNHGFAVDLWSLSDDDQPDRGELVGRNLLPEVVETPFGRMRPSHQNLNDGTLEGMVLEEIPAFSVQYHPEGAPGPSDAGGLFDDFVRLMDEAG